MVMGPESGNQVQPRAFEDRVLVDLGAGAGEFVTPSCLGRPWP